jgi:hypothetical protein
LRTLVFKGIAVAPFLEGIELSFAPVTRLYIDLINDLVIWLKSLPALCCLKLTT